MDVGASMEAKREVNMVASWYRGRAEWNPVGLESKDGFANTGKGDEGACVERI